MTDKPQTMLELIMAMAAADGKKGKITLEEFTRIRREGTEEELVEAVERMMAAGGYENLE